MATVPIVSCRRVRLTRRGRFLLLLAAVTMVTMGFLAGLAPGTGATSAAPRVPGTATVVVHEGDTLWSIARAAAPGRDVRPIVERLRRLNGLDGADLRPGQRILVPAGNPRPTRPPLRR